MIVAVDATSLAFLVNPDSIPPIDPDTGQPIPKAAERIRHLISELTKSRASIIVPTPALAEVLVQAADGGAEFINEINKVSAFVVAPFDELAAIELAAVTRAALATGTKKDGSQSGWQKVKLDRQICAIAKLHNAERFYTDDKNLAIFVRKANMEPVAMSDLPLPPEPEPDLLSAIA